MIDTFLSKDDLWALSITVTGRCNCYCSYCHFYAHRDRSKYNIDLNDDIYRNYLNVINEIKDNYHKNIQVRFSGGEPLVIGDRIFDLSNQMYDKTGIKPYILTNGILLNEDIIEKSKKNNISAYLVSIENPFEEDEGAPRTKEILEKIKKLDSSEVRVLPAIMIIKNKMFKKLLDIADYVYDQIGVLPSFSELTYQAYESPTEEELRDLYNNLKQISRKYYNKAPIRVFPYISPELYANNQKNYLSELDLENSINVNDTNSGDVAKSLFEKLGKSYKENPCENKECDWYEDCRIIKWLWFYPNENINTKQKLLDYCKFKKVINTALYDGIIGE